MHRILFSWGPITIYSYGVLVASAFFISTYLAFKEAPKKGIDGNKIVDASVYIIISGLIGARLFYVLIFREYYLSNPLEILKVWEGGLIFYGGFIFAVIGALIFLARNKIPVWKFADLVAPYVSLGIAIGRIGCFLNGCCFGRISDKYGFVFPCREDSPVCFAQVSANLLEAGSPFSRPVIPTQLYSSAACLLIFIVLIVIRDNKNFKGGVLRKNGFLFWTFVFLYGLYRFIIERFRFYENDFYFFSLTLSQIISLVLIAVSIVGLIILKRTSSKNSHLK